MYIYTAYSKIIILSGMHRIFFVITVSPPHPPSNRLTDRNRKLILQVMSKRGVVPHT